MSYKHESNAVPTRGGCINKSLYSNLRYTDRYNVTPGCLLSTDLISNRTDYDKIMLSKFCHNNDNDNTYYNNYNTYRMR